MIKCVATEAGTYKKVFYQTGDPINYTGPKDKMPRWMVEYDPDAEQVETAPPAVDGRKAPVSEPGAADPKPVKAEASK